MSLIQKKIGSILKDTIMHSKRTIKSLTQKSQASHKNEFGHYIENQRNGRWTSYCNDNVVKLSDGKYLNGQKHGKWSYCDKQSGTTTCGSYCRGVKIGVWKKYDSAGNEVGRWHEMP